jgi:hypothetical protein
MAEPAKIYDIRDTIYAPKPAAGTEGGFVTRSSPDRQNAWSMDENVLQFEHGCGSQSRAPYLRFTRVLAQGA